MNSAQWNRMASKTYTARDADVREQIQTLFDRMQDGEYESSTDPAFLADLARLVEDCGGVLLDICAACGKTVTANCNGANCS